MKNTFKKTCLAYLLLLTMLFCMSAAQAQQATTAAGGDVLGTGGNVAYSIGQVVYTTHSGTTGTVAQGVEQPYEISVVLGVEEHQIILTMQAYPNPTTSYLTLNVGNYELSNLNFQLFDLNGRLIENRKITTNIETIPMEQLPTATYLLKVVNNNKELKTFKIIKK